MVKTLPSENPLFGNRHATIKEWIQVFKLVFTLSCYLPIESFYLLCDGFHQVPFKPLCTLSCNHFITLKKHCSLYSFLVKWTTDYHRDVSLVYDRENAMLLHQLLALINQTTL